MSRGSAPYPPLFPAPPWPGPTSQRCILYHGCTQKDAAQILPPGPGIDLTLCRPDSDFGRGFYLTTSDRQARQWAWYRHYGYPPRARKKNPAVVLEFDLSRQDLAGLDTLVFVRPGFNNDDLWSIIHHFRAMNPPPHHCRPAGLPSWYEIVWGPVSVLWQQREAMMDADQVSFHTPGAVKLLQRAIGAGTVKLHVVQ